MKIYPPINKYNVYPFFEKKCDLFLKRYWILQTMNTIDHNKSNLNINWIKYEYKLIPNFVDVIVNFKNFYQYKTYNLNINWY